MLPCKHPDRLRVSFDDHRLVANAGLLLPATLVRHLGLPELVQQHLDLGDAPGRANTGEKMLTLVASAPRFRGGRVWRAATASTTPMRCAPGGRPAPWAARSRRHPPPAFARAGSGRLPAQLPVGPRPSTRPGEPGAAGTGLGRWGGTRRRAVHHRPRFHHLRDLRAEKGGGTPPRLHRCAGLPSAAGVAAHFLRETVVRVRYARAKGQLTVRADSGFYTHAVVALCRRMNVRFSITIRQRQSLRNLIEAIPEDDWTPIPYWMEGAAAVAETTYVPFRSEPGAAPVRLIVRRVKPTPGSQLALFATYSYHGFITDRYGDTLELEADHRRHAEVENAIRDLKCGVGLNHLPSGRFAANAAWLAVQVMAHNLARWAARIGLGERLATTRTLRRRFFSMAGRLTRSAR